ncbi:GNAT family N-acetyltransferase [Naasia aerilata]|uniref:N-acetyltransferase n=1 Tax=Naasia aerilata TaxID=1162966 RepID=A0ABM8GAI2_9MICO|nr:GNAT family N-acetyltransferase [Naasia aerilata]BDZ45222.1 N-acetyltransferase [Naasia aerilata]
MRTNRLLLRQWRDDDLPLFAALNADPEVMRHFPAPLGREASDALADRARQHLTENGWGLWAVEVVDGPHPGFVGFTGLARPAFSAHFTPAVEVGWRLDRRAWGFGYATEAARAALRYGFEDLGLDQIVSFTAEGNERSRAVMRRLAMTHDAADDFDHPSLQEGHPLRRHVLYRLSRTPAWMA